MKKMIVFACMATMFAACDQQKGGQDSTFTAERDSLTQIIEQKDNEINDMMGLFNEIEDGFRAINAAENRITMDREGEGASQTARIQEQMEFIQNTMAQNRELINKLRQQLRQSSVKGDQLKKTLDNLTKELENKTAEIAQLRAELSAKNIHIAALDQRVEELSTNVDELTEQNTQRAQTISSQDRELNTAWFVFGNKKELKEQHILDGGEVLRSNFNKEYFTKIDIRVDKEIKLYSKSAKMLTNHPAGTFTLAPDAIKQYVLRITDPQQFWSTSKYLVILVK